VKSPRALPLAAALVAVVIVSGPPIATSKPPGSTNRTNTGSNSATPATVPVLPTPAGNAGATPPPPLPPTSTVTLLTGDQVRLDVLANGEQSAQIVPTSTGKPAPATFMQFSWRGEYYVIPSTAMPYLSSVLDLSLFDVTNLVRAKLDDAHSATLPVKIGQSRRNAAANLPSMHVAHVTGSTATGTVAKKQLNQLGKLLAQQSRSGSGAATLPRQLDGVTRISLDAPATAPQPPAPESLANAATTNGGGLHYRSLTLDVTGQDGEPGYAAVIVQNLDDTSLSPGGGLYFSIVQSPASFSVPDGTYSVLAAVYTAPPSSATDFRTALVVKPQVTINSDKTISLDARAAKPYRPSLDPSISTPPLRADWLTLGRTGAASEGLDVDTAADFLLRLVSFSPNAYPGILSSGLSATPTSTVTKGSFGFAAHSMFVESNLGTGTQTTPAYYLNFPHAGTIPPSLTYSVTKADLTALRYDAYHNPYSTPSGCHDYDQLQWVMSEPWSGGYFGTGGPYVPPGQHTDYMYSSTPGQKLQLMFYSGADCTRLYDPAVRTIRPGAEIDEVWNKTPLVPSPVAPRQKDADGWGTVADVSGPLDTFCAACRQDANGLLNIMPLGDSDPTHHAYYRNLANGSGGITIISGIRFSRNGTLAITSDAPGANSPLAQRSPTGLDLPLLPQAATYQLDWTLHAVGDPTASSQTNWTFHSSPTDPAASLPTTEKCLPDFSRACSFLPLLFITYDLALNYQSQAKAGAPFQVAFTVEHQQNAPAPSGVAATLSVSYDDGKTWTDPQPATPQPGGKFTATITHPALAGTSGFVSLRVAAHDGPGNAVQQTIIRAYGLTDQGAAR